MVDTATHRSVQVSTDEASGPYIRVSLDQLEQVRQVLLDNKVAHWVEHTAISIDGRPAVVVINLGRGSDPGHVQALLDRAA